MRSSYIIQGAQPGALWWPRREGWKGWPRDPRMVEYTYNCGWFALLYGRNWHNIVKQFSSNKKINLKKKSTSETGPALLGWPLPHFCFPVQPASVMTATLQSYLNVEQAMLQAALCLEDFSSQIVEQHNWPEVEVRSILTRSFRKSSFYNPWPSAGLRRKRFWWNAPSALSGSALLWNRLIKQSWF